MGQFEAELQARAELAAESLRQARLVGDDYLADVRLGELEELARIAIAHDVLLPTGVLLSTLQPPALDPAC